MRRSLALLAAILVLLATAAVVAGWTWDDRHPVRAEGSTIVA